MCPLPSRFNGGVGRCAQAKAWGATQGRWPRVCRIPPPLSLKTFKKATLKLRVEHGKVVIKHIQVNQAPSNVVVLIVLTVVLTLTSLLPVTSNRLLRKSNRSSLKLMPSPVLKYVQKLFIN